MISVDWIVENQSNPVYKDQGLYLAMTGKLYIIIFWWIWVSFKITDTGINSRKKAENLKE